MPRPAGTNQCKHPGCERGTIFTAYCRKHRKDPAHAKDVEAQTAAFIADRAKKAS